MDRAMTERRVTIRGQGSGTLRRREAGQVTIACASRLLPGRPYVVQGVDAGDDNCRMRVAASRVSALAGEAGVVYLVTLRADS